MEFQRNENFLALIIFLIIIFSSLTFAERISKNNNGSHKFNTEGERYCTTCHVPIGFSKIENDGPRWFEKSETVEFKSFVKNTNHGHDGYPSGKSKLCLGCHDGIVAAEDKNIYSNNNQINGEMNAAYSSHNSHPVSIVYNSATALRNKHLADPSFEPSGLGGTIAEDLLEDGMITCTSCHNIHSLDGGDAGMNNHFNGGGAGYSMPLKIPNQRSALCLTCHKL
ncbi:MAG: hypothetical protein GXO87_11585 [Chlorobi bacterium]|nr:hypothetical protein [Chlorobiota bacterium]